MQKNVLSALIYTAVLLLVPLYGNFYIEGWNWSGGDFVVMGAIIWIAAFLFELARTSTQNMTYKLAASIAVAASFLLVWVNAAVNIIGDDNPVNTLYALIVIVGIIAAANMKFQSVRLSRMLFVVSGLLLIVPVIGLIATPENIAPGVMGIFLLSGFFAVAYALAGFLFQKSMGKGTA